MFCYHCLKIVDYDNCFVFYDTTNYNGFNSYEEKCLCNNCINKLGINIKEYTCKSCSRTYFRKEDIDTETHICYCCKNREIINPYMFKPDAIMFKNSDSELGIGLELEINGASSYKDLYNTCSNIKYLFKTIDKDHKTPIDFVYLKRDGSIGKFGCEIVTHPATIDYHKNNVPWKTFFDKYQIKGRKNCGLHFHVDKRYLTALQQKVLDIVVNESVDFISAISDRKPNRYCYQNNRKTFDNLGISFSRYEMINFGNNKTIEFRFFKSPKTYKSFITKIEFVDAIMKYIKAIKDKEINDLIFKSQLKKFFFWKNFVDYVKENNDKYEFLNKYFSSNKKINSVIEQYDKDNSVINTIR